MDGGARRARQGRADGHQAGSPCAAARRLDPILPSPRREGIVRRGRPSPLFFVHDEACKLPLPAWLKACAGDERGAAFPERRPQRCLPRWRGASCVVRGQILRPQRVRRTLAHVDAAGVGLLGANGGKTTVLFGNGNGQAGPRPGPLDGQDINGLPLYRRAVLGLG